LDRGRGRNRVSGVRGVCAPLGVRAAVLPALRLGAHRPARRFRARDGVRDDDGDARSLGRTAALRAIYDCAVDADEGFRLMAHGESALRIGDPVHVVFRDFAGRLVPFFQHGEQAEK